MPVNLSFYESRATIQFGDSQQVENPNAPSTLHTFLLTRKGNTLTLMEVGFPNNAVRIAAGNFGAFTGMKIGMSSPEVAFGNMRIVGLTE